MPTSDDEPNGAQSVVRREVHRRTIECRAHVREDGLLDIEASLLDAKSVDVRLSAKFLPAGEPLHRMTLRVAIDGDFVVREAEARTLDAPFVVCGDIAPNYDLLVGVTIGMGFLQEVRRLFRGTLGCTHLTELLPVIATTAFQASSSIPKTSNDDVGGSRRARPSAFGRCHALRLDGDTVRRYHPEFAAEPEAPKTTGASRTEDGANPGA